MRSAKPALAAAATVALALASVPVQAAAADEQPPPKKAAVVSPTISTLSFVDTILLPLGCGTGVGAVSTGAASVPGASAAVGPAFAQVTQACTQSSSQGATVLDQAATSTAPFVAINPVANPAIGAAADATQSTGTAYGPALAPFGPTIVALANDIRFFGG